jgi:hypothetical protein
MADIFERNHRCYGYRRIRASLGREDVSISEKVGKRATEALLTDLAWCSSPAVSPRPRSRG